MRLRFQLFAILSLFLAVPLPAQSVPAKPMAADAHPSFAVATIKPHDPNSRRQGFNAQGDRFTIRNQTVTSLMQFAYAIHPHQIVGAPGWVSADRYDIEGTTDTPGEPSLRQQQEMLQKLLADRFKLHFAREKRDLSVYAIQIAKGGAKLTPAANPAAEPDQEANGHGTEVTQIYTSAAMTDFAMGMQFFVRDRPIVDQTGLTGRYDIRLRYSSVESASSDPNAAPGLFTAIEEQLGLKLKPVKAPVDVFVIDRVEQPSAN
ncbi:MAG TPA: TIGR03435 family protein [Acidobacteriaceae bacterium]|jgi:uncharacterized protein (TIGR03435 family)